MLVNIGSFDGLLPDCTKPQTEPNDDLLSIECFGTNFSEIQSKYKSLCEKKKKNKSLKNGHTCAEVIYKLSFSQWKYMYFDLFYWILFQRI